MVTDTMIEPRTRIATAFFDTQDAAERARTDLVAAGIHAESITLAGQEATAASEEAISYDEGGFWHALKEFFMPDEDRYSYAEGLRRGGFALSVRASEADYGRALDILDSDGAVDIDDRAHGWKAEGWTGYQPGVDPLALSMPFAPADAGTAGFGASMAGDDGYQPHLMRTVETEDASGARAANDSLTTKGNGQAELLADTARVGTGTREPGLLNPDMRERIGSGTASMTPPTPTGPQDGALNTNAASFDRSLSSKAAVEDASLGAPTRSGWEQPSNTSTVGNPVGQTSDSDAPAWTSRRDETVQRPRVRGYILDSEKGGSTSGGNI